MASFVNASTTSNDLAKILHSVFGFTSFRANQEEVCLTAVDGRDLLLVMPTGAGKSLCYQLPAIARNGTALVISPLIALMDDQASKLTALGLRAARIHSGMSREDSRQACVDYLQGDLQFLFIAPERLRVPGFPEMLARRKPSLIAVDEAHCISQWGHDFRPDYRMLGQYLPALRPAPILALTATATPVVQSDILEQLKLHQPSKFIHGFRRNNLALEVVEVPLPQRADMICRLLSKPERRPAIVYATSRKQAEQLAEQLALRVPAAAYHAGLDAEIRERVQTAFLANELEVIVATIAFGMGIDKPNIRTVIHAGLPSTLEGYYQEIGRAGRDGKPSWTCLMHSFADRRTQDFFLAKDYPPANLLDRIYHNLKEEPLPLEELREKSRLGEEEFDRALEKLEIHGGALRDYNNYVTTGESSWKPSYTKQAQYRENQFQKVVQYTSSSECRMSQLVRHFGDLEDANLSCGICDVCNPADAILRLFRRANQQEREWVQQIIDVLRPVDYKAAGSLQRELGLADRMETNEFYKLLSAMEQVGLINIEDAEFEKDGQVIRYRKVRLTEQGLEVRPNTALALLLEDGIVEEYKVHSAPSKKKKTAATKSASRKTHAVEEAEPLTGEQTALADKLRKWRIDEAKRAGMPAFLVLNDRTLTAIARAKPATPNQLLDINGISQGKIDKYGQQILKICHKN